MNYINNTVMRDVHRQIHQSNAKYHTLQYFASHTTHKAEVKRKRRK